MSFHGMFSSSLSRSSSLSSSLSSNCVDICESDRFLRLGSSSSSSSRYLLVACDRGVSRGRGAIGVYKRRGCGEVIWLDDSSVDCESGMLSSMHRGLSGCLVRSSMGRLLLLKAVSLSYCETGP